MRKPISLTIGGLLTVLAGSPFTVSDSQFATNGESLVQSSDPSQSGDEGIYDPTPDHVWNRLYRSLYVRVSRDGRKYGYDELDPLLWIETNHLLSGASYQQAINLLDQFLSTQADRLVADPLKRAMLQRDLWAVFDWSTLHSYKPTPEKRELQVRLARVIRRLALSKEQIEALPNNYADAVAGKVFATQYNSRQPDNPFLPADLFQPEGPWVALSAFGGGPVALTHVFNFSGRSVFLVFMRLPEGRQATLTYLKRLSGHPRLLPNPDLPQFPAGTELVLVRQMLLIDNQANLRPTHLTESVQIRIHRATPKTIPEGINVHLDAARRLPLDVSEFKLSRAKLFAGIFGGLRPVTWDEKEFPLFQSAGFDLFELSPEHGSIERHLRPVLNSCVACHFMPGIHSVLSRQDRQLTVSWEQNYEANRTVYWKYGRYDWRLLSGLWELESKTEGR